MFLPWFVGNVVDSPTGEHYYGFVSTWGIFYDGKLHNAHEVFASGFWDIVTFLVSIASVTGRTLRCDKKYVKDVYFT